MPKASAPAPKTTPKVTPDPAPQTELKNFSDKQRDEWLLKGDVSASTPAKGTPKKDAKANGTAGQPKPEEVEGESPELELAGGDSVFSETETEGAAPTPQVEEPESETPPASATPPKTAKSRIEQLIAEKKTLKTQLEQLQRERSAIAAPPVAATDAPKEPGRNDTDEHGLAKYATDEAFRDAQRKWDREQAKLEAKQEIAVEAQKRADAEIAAIDQQRWTNSIAICAERYPDFKIGDVLGIDKDGKVDQAKVHPEFAAVRPGSALDRWILDSDFGAELVRYLVLNPGEAKRLQSFRSVDATVSAFAEVRSKILAGIGPKKAAPEGVDAEEVLERLSEVENPEEVTPPPKRVTSAPAPGTRGAGGGKGTAPKDPVLRALQTGNFEDYQRLENEAELSRLKAGVN